MSKIEFRSIEVRQVYESFTATIQPAFYKFFNQSAKKHSDFVKALERSYAKTEGLLQSECDLTKKVELQRELKTSLFRAITEYGKSLNEDTFNTFYSDFEKTVNSSLADLKRVIYIRDSFRGYSIDLLQNPFLTLQKLAANIRYMFILLGKKTFNLFRKVVNRKPLELSITRKRRVLFRSMARHFILNTFLKDSYYLLTKLMNSQSVLLIQIWEMDGLLDIELQKRLETENMKDRGDSIELKPASVIFKQVKSAHSTSLKEIKTELELTGAEIFRKLDEAYLKADTIDLPYRTFLSKKVTRVTKRITGLYHDRLENWKNTHNALLDDWSVDMEIALLYYSAFDEFNLFNQKIENYIATNITGSFQEIRTIVAINRSDIEEAGSQGSGLIGKLAEVRNRLSDQLIDKIITQTVRKLNTCFTEDFRSFEQEIIKLVDQVSERRGFIANKNYLRDVRVSEVKYISPRELLYFEALPVFKAKISEVEQSTENLLEKARINLMALGTVCDFSLESAGMMLEQHKESPQNSKKTAIDGFDRALLHLEKAEAIILAIGDTMRREVSVAINEFDDDIVKLKDTDNILELNLKIARIKAAARVEKYRKSVVSILRNTLPKSIELSGKAKNSIFKTIREIKLRLGIPVEKKYVSFELSEFMAKTQESLKKLPFVYQRLYQLSPTNEDRFFVDRAKELELLNASLGNWKKDRFITVAIIGEKGCGITSLINYFIDKSDDETDLIRHTLGNKIYTSESYFAFFSALFDSEKFQKNEQIINYLNQADRPLIVVLENLQHMFIKKVHGFDCKNMFFELMANTMKKVLWIGVYTTHSWNFLDRTIHISNYFTSEIYVEPMGQVTLEQVIFKRNQLSGYQIVFQPDSTDLVSKNYQKLNEIEKQAYLRRKFFTNLANMSSGNISLAQLYWLRSTRQENEEIIKILPISESDFSFVKTLSGEELFAMQALIIHDGLGMDDFAKVMGKPIINARNLLTPMLEKGLLIKPNIKYNINPIIYNPIASYLLSRNFIN